MGVRDKPRKMPRYIASDPSPEAVARSRTGNHRGSHRGDRIQDERLSNGDADLGNQHQGIAGGGQAAHQAKDAGKSRADPHRHPQAVRVDHPRGRNRDDDVDDHEDHRQQPDAEIRDAVELDGVGGDGSRK